MKGKVSLDEFTKELCLEKIYCPRDELDLLGSGINRPGLQLYGFYEHFDPNRIQVIGKVEVAYLMSLDEGSRNQKIDDFLLMIFPASSFAGIWKKLRFLFLSLKSTDGSYLEAGNIQPHFFTT